MERRQKKSVGLSDRSKPVFIKVGGHLTTLGFSLEDELAHHYQGQPPL